MVVIQAFLWFANKLRLLGLVYDMGNAYRLGTYRFRLLYLVPGPTLTTVYSQYNTLQLPNRCIALVTYIIGV